MFVALVVDSALISGPDSRAHPLTGLVVLAHLLPGLAVAVRRLHDTDHSGWFLLINVIPVVGPIVLLIWACQAGTPGPNQYGAAVAPIFAQPQALTSAPPAREAPPAGRDIIAEIERLAHLRASGSLSEAEFETMKARTLAQGQGA